MREGGSGGAMKMRRCGGGKRLVDKNDVRMLIGLSNRYINNRIAKINVLPAYALRESVYL